MRFQCVAQRARQTLDRPALAQPDLGGICQVRPPQNHPTRLAVHFGLLFSNPPPAQHGIHCYTMAQHPRESKHHASSGRRTKKPLILVHFFYCIGRHRQPIDLQGLTALDRNRYAQDSPLNWDLHVRLLAGLQCGLDFQVNQQENRYRMSQLKFFSGSLQRD